MKVCIPLRITSLIVFVALLLVSQALMAEVIFAAPEKPVTEQMTADPARGIKKKRDKPLVMPADTEPTDTEIPAATSDIVTPVLPKVDKSNDQRGQLSRLNTIQVKRIDLDGLSVFSREQLSSFLTPLEGKTISFEVLNNLRHELSQLYLSRGYINSGVTIPDQMVEEGRVVLRVIEGGLTSIEIDGLKRVQKSYIENTIFNIVKNPLNIADLSTALKLLNEDALIAQIRAKLLPGKQQGESVLNIAIKEASPYYYSVVFDNYLSPSVGSEHLNINAGHANVLGYADKLDLNLDLTRGLSGGNFSYNLPISRSAFEFGVFGDYRDTIVVEEPFDQIDIKSESYQIGLNLSQSFIKRLDEELAATYQLEVKHSASLLLQQPFSFSVGAVNGENDVSVLDLSLRWVKRLPDRVYSYSGSVRLGLPIMGATENEGNTPDGKFSLLRWQLQYAQRIPFAKSQILLRSGFQLAFDSLLSLEKYAIGGRYSVRGYRENQFVRDSGIAATLEWHIPLMAENKNNLLLIPFIDAGSSWDHDEAISTTKKQSISSIGLGLQWLPASRWAAELYVAHANKELPKNSTTDLQDDGIHFQVSYRSNRR